MPRVRRITIETVSACNLRCLHCAVSLDDYVGQLLSAEDFEKVVPMLKKWRPEVHLSGHGETLMHKRFRDMFLKVVGAGCSLGFQTNGVLLDRETIDFLAPHGGRKRLRWITVSLDAAEKGLFEKIRRRADWDVILEHLSYLRDRKARLGKFFPLLRLEFVAMRQNIHQLPDLVDLSQRLGAYSLVVSDLTEYPLVEGQNIRNDLESALPHLREALQRAHCVGLQLELLPGVKELLEPPVPRDDDRESPTAHECRVKLCTDPWEYMFLKAGGRLVPCCWIERPILDTAATSLVEGWKGEAYKELRRKVVSTEPPEECTSCFARPWIHIPAVAAGKPGLVYALFRMRRLTETLRRRIRTFSRGFRSPRLIARMIKAALKETR